MGDAIYQFGSGDIYATTSAGSVHIGDVQEASFEISFETKEVKGNKLFAVARARSGAKASGKIKTAQLNGSVLASILTGAVTTTGIKIGVVDESHDAAASVDTTFKTTWAEDRGVLDSTRKTMKINTGSPAVGEYKYAAGAYTFNASQTGKVYINYIRTDSTTGRTIKYSNQLTGTGPTYLLDLYNTEPDGTKFGVKIYAASIDKIALAFKSDDFTQPDMDYECTADANGDVFEFYLP